MTRAASMRIADARSNPMSSVPVLRAVICAEHSREGWQAKHSDASYDRAQQCGLRSPVKGGQPS